MFYYYLWKGFLIIESRKNEFNKNLIEVKSGVHSIDKQPSDCVILCNRIIAPYCDTMNMIYFNPNTSHELKYNGFNNHSDQFLYTFKKFISVHLNNIECPALFTIRMKILHEAAYHNMWIVAKKNCI